MRLWHPYLIKVLPNEQLVALWRELSACASSIQQKGTPNHPLVNFIMDYDFDNFISYVYYVHEEMIRRGYRTMNNVWEKIISLKPNYTIIPLALVYLAKMNSIYFDACWYNLYEKYLCGGINEKDWKKIDELAKSLKSNYYV